MCLRFPERIKECYTRDLKDEYICTLSRDEEFNFGLVCYHSLVELLPSTPTHICSFPYISDVNK